MLLELVNEIAAKTYGALVGQPASDPGGRPQQAEPGAVHRPIPLQQDRGVRWNRKTPGANHGREDHPRRLLHPLRRSRSREYGLIFLAAARDLPAAANIPRLHENRVLGPVLHRFPRLLSRQLVSPPFTIIIRSLFCRSLTAALRGSKRRLWVKWAPGIPRFHAVGW